MARVLRHDRVAGEDLYGACTATYLDALTHVRKGHAVLAAFEAPTPCKALGLLIAPGLKFAGIKR